MSKTIKPKKVKGRITVLKAMPYKDSMIYIRKINDDIFEYLVVFKSEIYSSYLIMKPRQGKTKLSKEEINQSAALIFAGAVSTVDTLRGEGLDKKAQAVADTFEANRKRFEGKGAN